MLAANQQYRLSQDPALRLQLPSSLPGYFEYERMVNDDKLAVYCLCVRVFCVSVFVCASILCVGNVKSHMLQDNIFGIHSRLSIS